MTNVIAVDLRLKTDADVLSEDPHYSSGEISVGSWATPYGGEDSFLLRGKAGIDVDVDSSEQVPIRQGFSPPVVLGININGQKRLDGHVIFSEFPAHRAV